MKTLFVKIRNAIFGRPLTHEEATARRDSEIAVHRAAGSAENRARVHSVQSQSYWM